TGDPDRPPPRSGTPMTDYIAGLYAAFGTSMAIIERQRTGRGQIVDTALYEGAFTFMESHIPTFQQLGIVAERAGSQLPGNAPNSVYPTRDGGYVLIAAAADAVFRRLADVIDRPDMKEDPRFAAAIPRAENMQACDEAVTAWTSQHDMADIERQLEEAGVPASRIFTVPDIFNDPHYQARNMLVDVEDDDLGPVTLTGIVPKLSDTPGHIRWTGRETGADTTSVLIEELGLDQAEIDDLADQGIVAGPSFSKTKK
ncbi:MAG: CoA transferase, partial [Pseudomonadota bacterium]